MPQTRLLGYHSNIQWEKNDTITALVFFGFNSYGPVACIQLKWKNNKTPYYMVYKNEECWQNGKK